MTKVENPVKFSRENGTGRGNKRNRSRTTKKNTRKTPMNDEKQAEILADLACIAEYAHALRRQIYDGETPRMEYLKDMEALAEKVCKQLDPKYGEWVTQGHS
jgi:hypothetical protein